MSAHVDKAGMHALLQMQNSLTQTTPRLYIETGTAFGDSALTAADSGLFERVLSIELSRDLYEKALVRFQNFDKVELVFGDSANWLEKNAGLLEEPVFWYLDAHFCKGNMKSGNIGTLAAPNHFPLWRELGAIDARPHADIVVVDDVHTFGRHRTDLSDGYTDYPDNWGGVTKKAIDAHLTRVAHTHVVQDGYVSHRCAAE